MRCLLRMLLAVFWYLWGSTAGAQPPRTSGLSGLKGEYFSGTNFQQKLLTRTDPTIAFNWNWQLPAPGVPHEYMSVRWTGQLRAPATGTYRFSVTADDGVRVWVAGKKIIDEWRKQDDSNFTGTVLLRAGQRYDLRVEYYNDWKGSIIYLFWEPPQPARRPASVYANPVPIPTQYLSPVLASKPVRLPKPSAPVAAPVRPPRAVSKTTLPKPVSRPVAGPVPDVADKSLTANPNPFDKLASGRTLVLSHVSFAQSNYTLLPESYAELDKLVQALRKAPTLQLEIAGHTDNVGDARLNQSLSDYRAKVVATYLTRQGIPEHQITAKGYGGSRPLVDNDTEVHRAQNRRVEIIVR